jgi:hypothetical protein
MIAIRSSDPFSESRTGADSRDFVASNVDLAFQKLQDKSAIDKKAALKSTDI